MRKRPYRRGLTALGTPVPSAARLFRLTVTFALLPTLPLWTAVVAVTSSLPEQVPEGTMRAFSVSITEAPKGYAEATTRLAARAPAGLAPKRATDWAVLFTRVDGQAAPRPQS